MPLDRAWIESHIPHKGGMCLLDEVVSWDGERITCRTSTHRSADNPLRAHGRLGIACGVEYAAQVMAVHGALTGGAPMSGGAAPPAGMLAGVRGVELRAPRLDDLPGDLLISASKVAGDGGTALYDFELACAARCVMRGRATVLLQVAIRMNP